MAVSVWLPIITGTSLFLFVALAVLFGHEQRRGSRILAIQLRTFLDSFLDFISNKCVHWYVVITRYRLRLSWYYGLHTVMVTGLVFLASVYAKIEAIVIINRDKVRQIRREKNSFKKNHLTDIAEYKVTVQLSKKEQSRRKKASLKGDY